MIKSKTKILKPGYFIYSKQKYLVNEALTRLKKNITAQSLGELNVVEVESPADYSQVEQTLATVGFFEQRKVVILYQAEKLTTEQMKKVLTYLDAPNPDVTLVLVALKKNERLFEQAKKSCVYHEYKSPQRGQLKQWVLDYLAKEGKKADLEIASYLISLTGPDLETLSNEIEKIVLYVGDKDEISIKDVSSVCSGKSQETIFDLVDALGQADLSMALWHLNNLFYTEKEGKMFHMIIRQFRLLLKTKGLMASNQSLAQLAKELKLPPFVVSKYQKQCKHFSTPKLIYIHSVLLETDIAYKTSSGSLKTMLEVALMKMLSSDERFAIN